MPSLLRLAPSATTGRVPRRCAPAWHRVVIGIAAALSFQTSFAADSTGPSPEDWRELIAQNHRLAGLLERQQQEIMELRERLDAFAPPASAPVAREPEPAAWSGPREDDGPSRLVISGEVGVAFFDGGADGAFPHAEFRVDDAKLFVDARARDDVFLFAELDLTLREINDEYFHLGEAYVEFAGLPRLWGGNEESLTLRAGRLDIPFGGEYLRRGVMNNPLITHSVSDFWGIDEGIEVFGQTGRLSYILAVQNGGHKTLHDYHADKSVTARLGFAPTRALHVTASVMRTGRLDRANDGLSELWIGNGFFRAIGTPATTNTFSAELAQVEAAVRWSGGHVRGDFGRAWYEDDDTAADNKRRLTFWQVEVKQALTHDLFAALRYSRLDTDRGYPLVGLGNFGRYFYGTPSRNLSRLAVGLGYQLGEDLILKVEATREHGRLVNGIARDNEDQYAAQAGVRF